MRSPVRIYIIFMNIVRVFLGKQKGKSIGYIVYDLLIRVISVIFFPTIWLLLYLINLFVKVKIGFLYHERLGHLALNTDLFLRRLKLGLLPSDVHYIFFVYSPANRQIVKMFKRHLNIVESEFLSKLLSPFGILNTRFYQHLPFIGNEYMEFNQCDAVLSFTQEEESVGYEKLSEMGIGRNDWYVCIFSRDHAYYKAFSPYADRRFSDHRNADIDTYNKAIQYIIDCGGYVVRMGSCVEKPLSFKHPKVIDYASSETREDFMDIFLSAKCKFYLSNTSGALDIAVVFDKPVAGVNWVPIGYSPFGKNSIYIPKKIKYKDSNLEIPFVQQLRLFVGNQVGTYLFPEEILSQVGAIFVDNTPDEILCVAVEMLDRLNDKFIGNRLYVEKLKEYFDVFPDENIYRANLTPIEKRFLMTMRLK